MPLSSTRIASARIQFNVDGRAKVESGISLGISVSVPWLRIRSYSDVIVDLRYFYFHGVNARLASKLQKNQQLFYDNNLHRLRDHLKLSIRALVTAGEPKSKFSKATNSVSDLPPNAPQMGKSVIGDRRSIGNSGL